MYSRFLYLHYDKLANDKQNKLREQFTKLENELIAGDYSNIERLQPPAPPYHHEFECIRNAINPDNGLTTSLVQLEILYFLVGKDNRIDFAKRTKVL